MTACAVHTARRNWPSWIATLAWVISTHRERDRAVYELQSLSDERLRDIGVERHDISCRIDSEMGKINLKRLGRIGLC